MKMILLVFIKIKIIQSHYFVSLATKIKENWIDDVTDECITIMYNGNDALTRIRQLNHKLGLISEEYSTYLKNKILNH